MLLVNNSILTSLTTPFEMIETEGEANTSRMTSPVIRKMAAKANIRAVSNYKFKYLMRSHIAGYQK